MKHARKNERADSWLLVGGRVARGPLKSEQLDIEIRSGRITAMRPRSSAPGGLSVLDISGSLVLPGLINAHDHLEFNLFPRLGSGPYPNAREWARDIYHPGRSPLREQLRLSLGCRYRWGALKNLLSGVTTVCHHNPYHSAIFSRRFPVRVPRRYGWAHSLDFSPDVLQRFRKTPKGWPFILHLGEAVDRRGREEVHRLDAMGALDSRTVLVHAVALASRGLDLVKSKHGALVWCPSSNMFILGRTLSRAALDSGIPVALGTDSALSGAGDLLDEIRFAHSLRRVGPERLYGMVTCEAAGVMRLRRRTGDITRNGIADLLVVQDSGQQPVEALLELTTGGMEMVFVRGHPVLVSAGLLARFPPAATMRGLQPVSIGGNKQRRVFVALDIPGMFRETDAARGCVTLAHHTISRAAA